MTEYVPESIRFYTNEPTEKAASHEETNDASERGYLNWLTSLEDLQAQGIIDAQERRLIVVRAIMTRDKQIEELQLRYRKEGVLARTDTLTGLPNRLAFNERIQNLTADNQPFGILLIDVDNFKDVNDEHGHAGGDSALVQVTLNAVSGIRQVGSHYQERRYSLRQNPAQDMLARLGGDEFAAVLPGVNGETLYNIAEKIRTNAGSSRVILDDPADPTKAENVQITLSIGGSIHVPGNPISITLNTADAALYESKRRGRNKTSIFLNHKK